MRESSACPLSSPRATLTPTACSAGMDRAITITTPSRSAPGHEATASHATAPDTSGCHRCRRKSCPCCNARMNNPHPWWLTWPVAEVAATIPPLFASWPSGAEEGTAIEDIIAWFRTGSYSKRAFSYGHSRNPSTDPDACAIAEAIQGSRTGGFTYAAHFWWTNHGRRPRINPTGRHALQTNTVRQPLGLGDAPPTT